METQGSTEKPQDISQLLFIKGKIMNYDWGMRGTESLVARLGYHEIKPELPYAEIWYGTHITAPSTICDDRETTLHEKIGKNLPFLLKVLSVEKPLSIQLHPNKSDAEYLHSQSPEVYKDPNHKPEMLLAITNFWALAGFNTFSKVRSYLKTYPEFSAIFDTKIVRRFVQKHISVNSLFRSYLTSENERSQEEKVSLITNLRKRFPSGDQSSKNKLPYWVSYTLDHFPNDWGVFSLFFLQLVCLEPNNALYIKPNTPHAYLGGTGVEAMACSDNVIRAGLTPKYKDVYTFCKFSEKSERSCVFKGKVLDRDVVEYTVGSQEFGLESIICKNLHPVTERETDSIIVILEGKAIVRDDSTGMKTRVCGGAAIYLYPEASMWIQPEDDSTIVAIRCFVPKS